MFFVHVACRRGWQVINTASRACTLYRARVPRAQTRGRFPVAVTHTGQRYVPRVGGPGACVCGYGSTSTGRALTRAASVSASWR